MGLKADLKKIRDKKNRAIKEAKGKAKREAERARDKYRSERTKSFGLSSLFS